jgi:hypothetical protein
MRKYIFPLVFLFLSCDPSGNLFLSNGYEDAVVIHTVYDYNGTILERTDVIYPGRTFAVAARDNRYKNITTIRIETQEGIVLAEYTPEYLVYLRNVYKKKKHQLEAWVFTEKGLFLDTDEIGKRYKWDSEKIDAYYRSDEAVQDLQAMMDRK